MMLCLGSDVALCGVRKRNIWWGDGSELKSVPEPSQRHTPWIRRNIRHSRVPYFHPLQPPSHGHHHRPDSQKETLSSHLTWIQSNEVRIHPSSLDSADP